MSRARAGGWYCKKCGYVITALPVGAVVCQQCGSLGMTGFDGKRPPLVASPKEAIDAETLHGQ